MQTYSIAATGDAVLIAINIKSATAGELATLGRYVAALKNKHIANSLTAKELRSMPQEIRTSILQVAPSGYGLYTSLHGDSCPVRFAFNVIYGTWQPNIAPEERNPHRKHVSNVHKSSSGAALLPEKVNYAAPLELYCC